jgi:tRNA nucleotidyltransferase (CCA-adding enzyme)
MKLFDGCDIWRKPERFLQFCTLAKSLGMDTNILDAVVKKVQQVNAGEIAKQVSSHNGKEIAHAVTAARLKAIASAL